ncbi:MAG: hypothetical protein NT062_18025, partial [Proteobacteria bacterium]|nr:hypothetical protein [Pseudomonadota bacterium]
TEVAREQAAVEVEKLVDAVVGTGTALGRTLETQRDPIVDAFRGADLAKAAEGLKLLADWMMHPTDEGRARVEELVLQLQRSMGTLVGYDPARDEAARKEELRLGVKASLDKIFKPKPKA